MLHAHEQNQLSAVAPRSAADGHDLQDDLDLHGQLPGLPDLQDAHGQLSGLRQRQLSAHGVVVEVAPDLLDLQKSSMHELQEPSDDGLMQPLPPLPLFAHGSPAWELPV